MNVMVGKGELVAMVVCLRVRVPQLVPTAVLVPVHLLEWEEDQRVLTELSQHQ